MSAVSDKWNESLSGDALKYVQTCKIVHIGVQERKCHWFTCVCIELGWLKAKKKRRLKKKKKEMEIKKNWQKRLW